MPDDIDLTAAIGRSPEEIVEYFESKGYRISWDWRETWKEANAKAFTVAGAMKMDVLKTIRGEVESAMEEGQTFREFRQNLEPKLKELGWWGRKEIVNEETGEVEERELGSVRRLRTIYRTNLQTSYNAGRWKNQQESSRELLEYIAVLDQNTRPTHRAADSVILPKDNPFWLTHYPPNGWGCRCSVRSLSWRQVDEADVADEAPDSFVSEGWDYNPGRAAFQPDLENYDDEVAQGYVEGVLTSSRFDEDVSSARQAVEDYQEESPDASAADVIRALTSDEGESSVRGTQYDTTPVAVLDEEDQERLDVSTATVQITDDTLVEQAVDSPDLTTDDYTRLPNIIREADIVTADGSTRRFVTRREGTLYEADVDVAGDALTLTAFQTITLEEARQRRQQGTVLRDSSLTP